MTHFVQTLSADIFWKLGLRKPTACLQSRDPDDAQKSDGGQEVKNTSWDSSGLEGSEYAKASDGPAGSRYDQNISRYIGSDPYASHV